MKPLSLRAGLTAWFFGLATLLLAVFSATLYFSIGRTLHSGLDGVLRARAESVTALCDWEEDVNAPQIDLSSGVAAEVSAGGPGRGFDVRTWPGGEILHASGEPIAAAIGEPGFASLDGRRLCVLLAHHAAVAATDTDPPKPAFDLLVRVADSLAPVEAQLARVAIVIALVAGVSLLVVLAFALFLSRRFVRPLKELGDAASEVRSGTRTGMPRRGTGDEVDRLAAALDEAFSSLQDALHRQTRFTADAAHELRNPISVIRSAADVALRQERSSEEYREFLTDVLVTAERMGTIVDALLLLARMDAGAIDRFETVDVSAVVREAIAGRERIRFSDGEARCVRGDARLIRILVDNLLSNALRYSKSVEVGVNGEAGRVLLSVRDFGKGIPAAELERVFERFYRYEPSTAGAGLGLSLVREVARAHAAECRIESSEAGTRVTVRFPEAAAAH